MHDYLLLSAMNGWYRIHCVLHCPWLHMVVSGRPFPVTQHSHTLLPSTTFSLPSVCNLPFGLRYCTSELCTDFFISSLNG